MTSNSQGQALLEFTGTVFFWLVGAVWVLQCLHDAWTRNYCAFLAFEATSSRIKGKPWEGESRVEKQGRFIFESNGKVLQGTAVCGPFRETVALPYLTSAKWGVE